MGKQATRLHLSHTNCLLPHLLWYTHVWRYRMAALQAELDLLRSQMGSQQLKLDQAADEAQAVLCECMGKGWKRGCK